ncbi:MAG: adenylate/guanylate cyclase domain-containing protein [Anaerolineae bacterium]
MLIEPVLRYEGMVARLMGDAINVAARMERAAQTRTILITEDTYKLIAPLFEAEPLGPIEVKEKEEPVPTYRPPRRFPVAPRTTPADGQQHHRGPERASGTSPSARRAWRLSMSSPESPTSSRNRSSTG